MNTDQNLSNAEQKAIDNKDSLSTHPLADMLNEFDLPPPNPHQMLACDVKAIAETKLDDVIDLLDPSLTEVCIGNPMRAFYILENLEQIESAKEAFKATDTWIIPLANQTEAIGYARAQEVEEDIKLVQVVNDEGLWLDMYQHALNRLVGQGLTVDYASELVFIESVQLGNFFWHETEGKVEGIVDWIDEASEITQAMKSYSIEEFFRIAVQHELEKTRNLAESLAMGVLKHGDDLSNYLLFG